MGLAGRMKTDLNRELPFGQHSEHGKNGAVERETRLRRCAVEFKDRRERYPYEDD